MNVRMKLLLTEIRQGRHKRISGQVKSKRKVA